MIDMSPNEAVKKKLDIPQTNDIKEHELQLPEINVSDQVRYLLQGGEHETGSKYTKRRATDPIWSLDLHEVTEIKDLIKPAYYYLEGIEGHKLREELQLVTYIIH